ncbi:FtsQ-type POTRA domain-containing protein [Leifsonia sp. NPDC058292]|uniref:FtsQ-type POTRA domain-containing protein n=1 Tax=Leifsonia sp. NPDC058292 TaxID=3346428 RepID=UPI0036DB390D
MKRPQGFDRSSAAAGTSDRDATTAPVPVQETRRQEAARPAATVRSSGASAAEPNDAGPWWKRPNPTDDATDARVSGAAGASGAPAADVSGKVAAPKSPYGHLPSNREINRALRAARKERSKVERGEVRRFTKRSRRRRMVWLASLGTLVVLVVAVALTAFSPLMALRTIDVAGTSRIDAAAVKKALEGQLGRPLPLVDQGAIRSDLATFPLIRSYSVESHPPNTIVVRIVERQPIGVVMTGSKFAVVDAAKVTIQTSDQRPDGYPIIKASGAAVDSDSTSGFAAAASVLSALPPALLAQVDTITAATRDDVNFTLRDSGATVVWGSADDSGLKAVALDALLKSVPGAGRYDVSSPHSVTTG